MEFREDALEMWKQQEVDNELQESEKRQEDYNTLIRQFHKTFFTDTAPDSVDPSNLSVCTDGVTLYWNREDSYGRWVMRQACPECGEMMESTIYRIADVGENLTKFNPDYHDCPASKENRQSADWPEWVRVGDRIIHLSHVKIIHFNYDGTVTLSYNLDQRVDLIVKDEADKFLAWWELRQGRDDVVVL